jgi:endonuclease-3
VRKEDRATAVVARLGEEYPDAECELDFRDPWELLVATVLSAQCTDERVNQVTPTLFGRWPTVGDLATAKQEDVESVIRSTGFFRHKAASLRRAARVVVAEHGGRVPQDLDALVALPGVGRKTAKVVLGEAFGIAAGVAVDTHVRRLARRIGLTTRDDPEKIAADLERLIHRDEWVGFSMRMILHGRRVCVARKPRCEGCVLEPVCRKRGL